MTNTLTAILTGAALSVSWAGAVQAETEYWGNFGAGLAHSWNSGISMNDSGPPADEPANFNSVKLSWDVGALFENGFSMGLFVDLSKTDIRDEFGGGILTDDGATGGDRQILSFGYSQDNWYGGAFAGLGAIRFTSVDAAQNANYSILGFGGGYDFGTYALGGSLAFMDVFNTTDPETLDSTVVVKLQGEYALANGRTDLGMYLSYTDGVTDTDSSSPDDVEGTGVGIYVRHKIGTLGDKHDMLLDARLDHVKLGDYDPSGSDDIISTTQLYVGLKIEFGSVRKSRAMRMAEPADTNLMQAVVPILD